METVRQDFEFDMMSLTYGRFLQEVHETCPGINPTNVSNEHRYKPNVLFVRVDAPKELAVVLKLRFGHHIRIPRTPKEINDEYYDNNKFIKLNIIKNRYYEKYTDTREHYINDLVKLKNCELDINDLVKLKNYDLDIK